MKIIDPVENVLWVIKQRRLAGPVVTVGGALPPDVVCAPLGTHARAARFSSPGATGLRPLISLGIWQWAKLCWDGGVSGPWKKAPWPCGPQAAGAGDRGTGRGTGWDVGVHPPAPSVADLLWTGDAS